MPAGAPYGNKNAEKWSFKKAIQLYNEAIKLTCKKSNIKNKDNRTVIAYDYDFIGEIARELGTFKDIFNHLADRFKDLQRLKNELYTNIETNCYWNTKNGVIREATGIVNLKSNWKWKDRQDLTSDDEKVQPNQVSLTDEQIDKIIDGLKPKS